QRSTHRLRCPAIHVVLNRRNSFAFGSATRILLDQPVPNDEQLIQRLPKRRCVIAIAARKISSTRHKSPRYKSRTRQFDKRSSLPDRQRMRIWSDIGNKLSRRRTVRNERKFCLNLCIFWKSLCIFQCDRRSRSVNAIGTLLKSSQRVGDFM